MAGPGWAFACLLGAGKSVSALSVCFFQLVDRLWAALGISERAGDSAWLSACDFFRLHAQSEQIHQKVGLMPSHLPAHTRLPPRAPERARLRKTESGRTARQPTQLDHHASRCLAFFFSSGSSKQAPLPSPAPSASSFLTRRERRIADKASKQARPTGKASREARLSGERRKKGPLALPNRQLSRHLR